MQKNENLEINEYFEYVDPIDKISPSLICKICMLPFVDPVVSDCKHTFCAKCFESAKKSNQKCPVCGEELKITENNTLHEVFKNMVDGLLIKCPNHIKSCEHICARNEIKEHLKQCPFQEVTCENEGCEEKILRKDQEKHNEICAFKLVDCPQKCGAKLQLSQVEEHLKTECKRTPIQCELCKEWVPKEEIEDHMENECRQKIIKCPHYASGCNTELKRQEMMNHLQNDCPYEKIKGLSQLHNQLIDEVLFQQKQIDALVLQIEQFKELCFFRDMEAKNNENTSQNENTITQSGARTPVFGRLNRDKANETPKNLQLTSLSKELLLRILHLLEKKHLILFAMTSKFSTEISFHPSLWKNIDLSNQPFTTCEQFFAVLKQHPKVEALDLSSVLRKLEDKGQVINYVTRLQNLKKLNLSNNYLSAADTQILADSLKDSRNLTSLDLSWNFMSSSNKTIAQAVENNTSLKYLNMTQNYVRDDTALEFARILDNNSSLITLNLSANLIRKKGGEALVKAFQKSQSLCELNISSNKVGAGIENQILEIQKSKSKSKSKSISKSNSKSKI
ncbi:tnf receptor associated factor [Anaeramoeba ignava]|uniref:Tnf receptor associated factor n=1 Tax=Anaeramoeba ignava TaxID=1746090 RepID=A0A9Q0R9U6_ANAIG|nr:tnf receptor associated factor [Anaeramoeba ignava]